MWDKIIEAISEVYDPEIPVNVWELGLIYEIEVYEDNSVKVVMTLTSPNCPVAEILPTQVEQAAASVEGVKSVFLELTFEPPFDPSMMSEEARFMLDMM